MFKQIIKRLFFSGIFGIGGVGLFIFNHYGSEFEGFKNQENEKVCGVIFGAMVRANGQPSGALMDRIWEGKELFRTGKINCLVLSGGESESGAPHEADAIRDELIKLGIDTDFILDYDGVNTQATINNLKDKDSTSYVLISNDFHLARIGLFARKYGVKQFALHADHEYGAFREEFYYYCREIAAVSWYFKWYVFAIILGVNFLFTKWFKLLLKRIYKLLHFRKTK